MKCQFKLETLTGTEVNGVYVPPLNLEGSVEFEDEREYASLVRPVMTVLTNIYQQLLEDLI